MGRMGSIFKFLLVTHLGRWIVGLTIDSRVRFRFAGTPLNLL